MISNDDTNNIALSPIESWQVADVELKNSVPLIQAIGDDDPTYQLKATIKITYQDGSQAEFAWESWRYGLVIAHLIVNLGDGPPGFFTKQ